MKKFAFLLFLLLFIAAACIPAFSKGTRGWDRNRGAFIAATRSRSHWHGDRSYRAERTKSWRFSRCTKDEAEEEVEEQPADETDETSDTPTSDKQTDNSTVKK